MATERNPFEMISEEAPNVVPMESIENDNNTETTFEVSEDGGIIVNFDQSTEIEEESWQKSIDSNLKSAVMMSKHAVPIMSESGGGSIINISSIDAIRAGGSKNVPYSDAKAGISHLTRIMAVHHGRQKISRFS